jgi:hypothetical protein
MKKFNQKDVNRILFQILFENEEVVPPIPELGNPEYGIGGWRWVHGWDGLDDIPPIVFPGDSPPETEEELEQQEREERERDVFYYNLSEYYRQFQEWYRREYPDDNDPGRLQRAWEAMQREIQRLINQGYTWHEIRKYFYRNTDGKHNRNYEDFPDWYHKENWQEYGPDKDKWDIPRRYGQGWR